MQNLKYENIGGNIKVAISDFHTFGTDSFLLSYFATPKNKDIVCDLGTGCGIIPLLWFRDKNKAPKHVYGVDVQRLAIEQLSDSILSSGINNFTPILCDLKNIRDYIPSGTIDLVTCNPPYKAEGTGIISFSKSDKIARHETLCTIDDVCKSAAWLLRFNGRLCICQLTERLADVIFAMRSNGIEPKRMRFVQNKSDSAPYLVLVEGKRGAKPFLSVDPPLILREGTKTSSEMIEIYGMYGKVE